MTITTDASKLLKTIETLERDISTGHALVSSHSRRGEESQAVAMAQWTEAKMRHQRRLILEAEAAGLADEVTDLLNRLDNAN